jgi:hypothetical protein
VSDDAAVAAAAAAAVNRACRLGTAVCLASGMLLLLVWKVLSVCLPQFLCLLAAVDRVLATMTAHLRLVCW